MSKNQPKISKTGTILSFFKTPNTQNGDGNRGAEEDGQGASGATLAQGQEVPSQTERVKKTLKEKNKIYDSQKRKRSFVSSWNVTFGK